MPIDVVTGQPGNGKTLYLMEKLLAESKKTREQGRRFLVACGIEGLAPGLVDLELPHGKLWNDVDFAREGDCLCHDGTRQVLEAESLKRWLKPGVDNPDWLTEMALGRPHAHVVPDGSLIYVDEAWKDFGHLHDASRAPTPTHVLALAEHRHRGLDFLWTTQQANQIYPFVRGLIGTHTHVSRKFGTKVCTLFQWGELCEDVKSQTQRDKSLSSTWVHPSAPKGQYKSASDHTIKSRLPLRLLAIPVAFIACGVLIWFAYQWMKPEAFAANLTGEDAAASGVAAAPATTGQAASVPTDAEGWIAYLTPALPGMAFTAPAFAESLEVQGHPRTLCTIVGESGADACHCYTEQATRVAVDGPVCRTIALHGYYDPFRPALKVDKPRAPRELSDAEQADLASIRGASAES
jgi:hypothetical protein